MSEADKYRAFARECIRWAEGAQDVEHREALLDMATAWADAAAQLDRRFALIHQFDDLAHKSRKNFSAATDGHGQTMQGNGSGQTKQTESPGGSKQQLGEPRDAPE